MPTAVPATFRSAAALAAAVDEAFAEALQELLGADAGADALQVGAEAEAYLKSLSPTEPAPPSRPFGLPDIDTLIRAAGIATGPSLPDPRVPSPAAQLMRQTAKTGGRLAGRAAWWLLKTTAYVTAVVIREVIVTAWELLFGTTTQPQQAPVPPAPRGTGRAIAPSDFLRATSAEIERRGWTQYALEDMHGRVCMLGAERALIQSGTGTWRTARNANDHIRAVTGARSVPAWNDSLRRHEPQIHAALLTAAARARAAGE